MKQIFDWLRAQIKYKSYTAWNGDTKAEIRLMLTEKAEEIINEAEAKWEADCCEWKPTLLHNQAMLSNCFVKFDNLKKQDVECFKFCPYCGKPIKIVEVK